MKKLFLILSLLTLSISLQANGFRDPVKTWPDEISYAEWEWKGRVKGDSVYKGNMMDLLALPSRDGGGRSCKDYYNRIKLALDGYEFMSDRNNKGKIRDHLKTIREVLQETAALSVPRELVIKEGDKLSYGGTYRFRREEKLDNFHTNFRFLEVTFRGSGHFKLVFNDKEIGTFDAREKETKVLIDGIHVKRYNDLKLVHENGPELDIKVKAELIKKTCYDHAAIGYVFGSIGHMASHERYEIPILGAILYHQGKLRLLTDEVRKIRGGVYTEEVKLSRSKRKKHPALFENYYKILAAYDCQNSTVLMDPELTPFDAGSLLVHELDHLMRDKYVKLEDVPDNMSFRTFILLDETLAASHAAIHQIRIQSGARSHYSRWGFGLVQQTPHKHKYDLRMFNPKGALKKLWYMYDNRGARDWTMTNDFFGRFFLAKERKNYVEREEGQEDKEQELVQSIYHMIKQGYFHLGEKKEVPLTDEEKIALNPRHLSLKLDPLGDFQKERRHISYSNRSWSNIREGRDARYKKFEDFIERLEKPAPLCERFLLSARRGELKGYVGLMDRPGDEGVRPGDEGARPAHPVRPCLVPHHSF